MKRLLFTTSLALVVVVPQAALAHSPTRAHVKMYLHDYHKVRALFGERAPGCKLVGQKANCHGNVTDAKVVKSTRVLEGMIASLHPDPAPAAFTGNVQQSYYVAPANGPSVSSTPLTTTAYSSAGGYSNVPGVPSSFASCVAMRESTDGAGSSNIYGIQGPGGQGSIAEQKAAFSRMYAARGTEPWTPYDGC